MSPPCMSTICQPEYNCEEQLCTNQYLAGSSCRLARSITQAPARARARFDLGARSDPRCPRLYWYRRPDPLGRSSKVAGAAPRGSEGTKHPGTGGKCREGEPGEPQVGNQERPDVRSQCNISTSILSTSFYSFYTLKSSGLGQDV